MKKIFLQFKNKRACPNHEMKRGIALLFVVMLSSILLVVALSISEIATKEAVFSTSAKNANEAFYAADAGVECALLNDKRAVGAVPENAFILNGAGVECGEDSIPFETGSTSGPWKFKLSNIGNSSNACAVVTVTKQTETPFTTTIISKGYNRTGASCAPTQNSVERELKVTYPGEETP